MFDTIQDKIILELKKITDLKTVGDYEGQFEEDISDIQKRFPVAFVDIDSINVEEYFNSGEQSEKVVYEIFVGCKSLRRSIKRDAVYSLIKDIKTKLHNNLLGLEIEPLKFNGVRKLVSLPGIIVYGIIFETAYKEI